MRSSKNLGSVLLPGATEAEPWELWTLGDEPECTQVCREPAENRSGGAAVLALPVHEVFCLPLWLNETDAAQFRGMIELQLEARGLQPRGQEAIFNWSVVAHEDERTLVLVAVLPPVLSAELETEACRAFDVAPRYFALAPDAMTFWREQGRLVVAITRGTALIYFQALAEAAFTPRVLQDVTCLSESLRMQEVISDLRQVVLWAEADPAEINALQATCSLPVVMGTQPAPRLPTEPWNLVPARVGEAKRQRQTRRWQWRGLVLGLIILAFIAGAFGLHLILVAREVAQLRQWQSEHAAVLQQIHATQAAWKDLQPVVDEEAYPLELLLHVSKAVPGDTLHLTLFEVEAGHILIKAEAKNPVAAFQFLDQLKKSPHFARYTWEMGQPHSLANDVTQLQIDGTPLAHD